MEPKTIQSPPTNTVASVSRFLERFAPTDLAEDWDNVGLLVGDPDRNVQRMMTCLTLTPDVAAEAISEKGIPVVLVSGHPDARQVVVENEPVIARICKPAGIDDVQRAIKTALDSKLAPHNPR